MSDTSHATGVAKGRYARARRALKERPHDPAARAAVDRTRSELAYANIRAAIERNLATAPPLSDEQADRLAALLRDETGR